MGIHKQFNYTDESKHFEQLNEEIICIRIIHQILDLYVINIYTPIFKKWKIKLFEEILTNLISKKPQAIWLIAGDYNTHKNPLTIVRNISGI